MDAVAPTDTVLAERPAEAKRAWTIGRGYVLLIIPPALFFSVFFLWPLARVVIRSVMEPQPGLGNYEKVLFSGPYLKVLLFTLEIAAEVTVVCLLVGYPVAALISRLRRPWGAVLSGLIVASLWTSAVVRSYAWMILFQRFGVVNQALIALGLTDEPVRILQTRAAVLVGMVHILLPFMLLPLMSAMRRIDRSLLVAGRMLGAGPVQLFWRVYLPLTLPGVSAGVALVFISALGFFITPALLGGGRMLMAAMLIEELANTYLDWPLACTLSTILLAMTLVLYGVFRFFSRSPVGYAAR